MSPTMKDVENPTPTSSPAPPPTAVAKPPQDGAARPQPVPLEVAVSVNGARTIEGSDKREPFSESTKTVLVFANGAVIRLASNVAAGQLLFVTNEKTKKEVVCQVVKSKNYRTVTGYVELEFTEPAAGFWGVRIPTEVPPTSSSPKAPVAPPRPAAPVSTQQGAPANSSAIPQPKQVVAPSRVLNTATVLPKPEAAKPAAPPVLNAPVAPPQTAPVDANSLSAQLAAQFSVLVGTELPPSAARAITPGPAKPAAPQKSGDASTEELREQTARLQEQLSSLLFRDSATEKTAASAVVPTPVAPAPVAAAKQSVAAPTTLHSPVLKEAAKETDIAKSEIHAAPIKVSAISSPTTEIKAPSVVLKTPAISLPVEEVKIPSWLAPLAREVETSKENSSVAPASAPSASEDSSYKASDEFSSDLTDESSQKAQTVVFGGQLLGGSDSTEVQASASGSKKGLVFGLIAATVLAAVGVGWYGLQPGNFLASKPASVPAVQHNSLASSEPAVKTETTVATPASAPNSTASGPASTAATSRPSANLPAAIPPVVATRNSNFTSTPVPNVPSNTVARAATLAPAEAPKKPALGDLRVATPNVNRSANSATNEAAPSIDTGEAAIAAVPLAGLAGNHGKEPSAPLPIGGDVKPAHLLKSVPPVYPASARSQRIGGNVQLDALIDAAGNVTATKVISGPTLLHQAAMTAVRQWKYAPAELDGKPTAMHLTVTVQFRLQ